MPLYKTLAGIGIVCLSFSRAFTLSLEASETAPLQEFSAPAIIHDADNKLVTMTDKNHTLRLRLNYDHKCLLGQVMVNDKQLISPALGVYSAIKISGTWYDTRTGIELPDVAIIGDTVTVSNINFGPVNSRITESWIFSVNADNITWKIDRTYHSGATIEDSFFPCWNFSSMNTWTGALLGNGGVAWCKLLDLVNATYGVHTGRVTLWNKDDGCCLRIIPDYSAAEHLALKFSHLPDNIFSLNYSLTENELQTKHELARFLADRQDVWSPFNVSPSRCSVTYTLAALDYHREYDRGTFPYFTGDSIRDVLDTIARVGVIDTGLMGGNDWRTSMGWICLHEQYIAQMGLAVDDENYFDNYKTTLDYYRDHAIQPDGRVKARWAYKEGDAIPGSYDSFGFYEAQWGILLDSNPDLVTNVAELYDFNGDLDWLRTHKQSCEKALDYLLARDTDGDALVEMMTDYHAQEKGSDWIDVIWAAYENAFVNAKLYHALILWSDLEEELADRTRAGTYRDFAERLKANFNKDTDRDGFWDPNNQWYVYWRDKDDSIHGNNLVTPVNFMAIGYGLCDDPARRDAILSHIETQMQKENLFFWPLSFYPYNPDEGLALNFPFPSYENGDIFLSWGELGIRAYKDYDPAIPIKYIRKVLDKYRQDGLAYQRYLRTTQAGSGNDILAGNCLPIVGLYRDIYGIQPKYNRLYLEPHLTTELNGTQIKYRLRNQPYLIDLNLDDYCVTTGSFQLSCSFPFGVNAWNNSLRYFPSRQNSPSLSITKSNEDLLTVRIISWPTSAGESKKWIESSSSPTCTIEHLVSGLTPNAAYSVFRNDCLLSSFSTDSTGCFRFDYRDGYVTPQTFTIAPAAAAD